MNDLSSNQNPHLGPAPVNAVSFALKILSGLIGGSAGSLIIFGIFLLSSSILTPVLEIQEEQIHPLFIFIFLGMIFLGTLGANITGSLFLSLSAPEKQRHISSSLYQVFIANLIIFVIITPVYLIVAKIQLDLIAYAAGVHIIMSTQATALIQKIITNSRYALLGVYSTLFAIFSSLTITFFLYRLSESNLVVLLFSAIPSLWICLAFFDALIGSLYFGLYSLYGVDFLSSETVYGNDGEDEEDQVNQLSEEEQDEVLLKVKKDDKGQDFLNKI